MKMTKFLQSTLKLSKAYYYIFMATPYILRISVNIGMYMVAAYTEIVWFQIHGLFVTEVLINENLPKGN